MSLVQRGLKPVVMACACLMCVAAHADVYELDFYKRWSQEASGNYTLTDATTGEDFVSHGDAVAEFFDTSGVSTATLDGAWLALNFSSFRIWWSFVGDDPGGVWTGGYQWSDNVFGYAFAFGDAPLSHGWRWYFGSVAPAEPAPAAAAVEVAQ